MWLWLEYVGPAVEHALVVRCAGVDYSELLEARTREGQDLLNKTGDGGVLCQGGSEVNPFGIVQGAGKEPGVDGQHLKGQLFEVHLHRGWVLAGPNQSQRGAEGHIVEIVQAPEVASFGC